MVVSLRQALLDFYDAHARDLPWRRTRDPYAIWVSEIMLQQTRVDTVLRYFDRFLERFPTTHALASANEDDVLSAWSGLGYYRRARLLHAGVRDVVARYGGQVPEDAEARRGLPGVGRYTAGAIGSIAFERQEPIVDGNVARVLSRALGIDTPLGRADTEARLWQHAEALCRGPRPGALNQALMELGALICTKAAPKCEQCPLRTACVAYAEGRTAELPVVRKKKPAKKVQLVMLALIDPTRDAIALVRGEGELFGGLWNLPAREGKGLKTARALLGELSLHAELPTRAHARFEHVLTHRHLHIELFVAKLASQAHGDFEKSASGLRLTSSDALAGLGVSSLTTKAIAHARASNTARDVARTPRT